VTRDHVVVFAPLALVVGFIFLMPVLAVMFA
jgi:hypothetical protein